MFNGTLMGAAKLPFKVRYGSERNFINSSKSVWNRFGTEFIKFSRMVRNPRSFRFIRVTKHYEMYMYMYVLQTASIVGLARNSKLSGIPEIVRYGSVSDIPIPNRIPEFRRPLHVNTGRSICDNCRRLKRTRAVKDGQRDTMHAGI